MMRDQILSSHLDLKENIVRNELIYYDDTHKNIVLNNPAKLKVNKNSQEERLVNFFSLLVVQRSYSSAQLPSNRDAKKALVSKAVEVETKADQEIEVGKYKLWYIASCKNMNDNETFHMDNFIRVQNGNDST